MCYKIQDLIAAISPKLLSHTQKAVLTRMARYGNADGTSIFPGTTRLANDLSMTTRSIIRIRNIIERMGILEVVHLAWAQRATEYKINIAVLEALASQKEEILPVDNQEIEVVDNMLINDTVSSPPLTQCHLTPDTVSDNLPLPIINTCINTVGEKFSVENSMEVAKKHINEDDLKILVEFINEKRRRGIPLSPHELQSYKNYIPDRIAA